MKTGPFLKGIVGRRSRFRCAQAGLVETDAAIAEARYLAVAGCAVLMLMAMSILPSFFDGRPRQRLI